jgi:hypothetical protein
VVAKGEIQTVDFHPKNGGTRILKGIMVAGKEGEELSWKLGGTAEVKVSISATSHPVQSLPAKPLSGHVPSCQTHFYLV